MENHDADILIALIEGNQQFLQTLVETGMSWWVSSVAFCAAVVVAIWLNRDNVMELYAKHRLAYQVFMSLVLIFLLSVVGYGLWMIRSVLGIKEQLAGLIEGAEANLHYSYFEFTSIGVAFVIGTTSFMILSVIWVVVWVAVSKYLADKQAEK